MTEDPTPRSDGGRWLHTPGLGIHYAQTDSAGNVVIGEDRIRYAMEVAAGDAVELQRELQVALGAAWDEELEPFRHASDDAPRRLAAQGRVRADLSGCRSDEGAYRHTDSGGARRHYRGSEAENPGPRERESPPDTTDAPGRSLQLGEGSRGRLRVLRLGDRQTERNATTAL